MRLVFTSDLHVEYHLEVVGLVAERARKLKPDVLVLAGDVCPDLHRLESALRLLVEAVEAPVLYLPGNHELWCGGAAGAGPDSRERYLESIPTLTRRAGAVPLGVEPFRLGKVAFVGVTGWYDYTLRDPTLTEVGEADYRAKKYSERACVDGRQVHWPDAQGEPLSDQALTNTMCELLTQQLDAVSGQCSRLVAVTHMLVTRDLIQPAKGAAVADRFEHAFQGSARIGELLARRPELVRVICGHYHRRSQAFLPGVHGEVICEVSPVGYPRELERSLAEQVAERVRVVGI